MTFSRFASAALLAALLTLAGCGTHLEADPLSDPTALLSGRFQLLVRTDSATLDRLVYEAALRQLAQVLPLAESEPFTGAVELTFSSTTAGAPIGVGGGTDHYSGGWYSGHSTEVAVGLSAASALTWQNAVLSVVVKDASGQRLWSATCRHRGSLGLGDSGDAAGERAARRCLEEVVARLRIPSGSPGSVAPAR